MDDRKSREEEMQGAQRTQRHTPVVKVASSATALDFVRNAVTLSGRDWIVEGMGDSPADFAALIGQPVDLLLTPIEILSESSEIAAILEKVNAAIVPFRTTTQGIDLQSNKGRSSSQSVLALSSISPTQLVDTIEEAIERWSHSRILAAGSCDQKDSSQIEFLSAVNHEVRTPLNAILGLAESLLEVPIAPELIERIRMIRTSGKDLLCVLDQLVDLARLRAGRIRNRCEDLDLESVLHEAAEEHSLSIHRKGLGLSVSIDNGLPATVRGDRTRLAQTISILIRNALRMTTRGEILLSARRDSSWTDPAAVCFEVRHTGDQLGLGESGRITSEATPISRDFSGVGIGLSLVEGLVRSMGSELVFDEHGRRLSFTLNFQPIAMRRGDTAPSRRLHGARALVVGALVGERTAVSAALEQMGALAGQANQPSQAVEAVFAAQRNGLPYELILIQADHCERALVDEIAGVPGESPTLIALTHDDATRDATDRLLEAGVAFRIDTPSKPEEICRAIECVLTGEPRPENLVTAARMARSRILVVDDSPENRGLVKMYLRGTGYEYFEAGNGEEAVRMARGGLFDLILMDIQMPELNGYEATARIRADEEASGLPACPIIALTAFSMEEDAERSLEAGCSAHLSKPIAKQTLLEAIERQLSTPSRGAPSQGTDGRAPDAGDPADDEAELARRRPTFLENRLLDARILRAAARAAEWEEVRVVGHRLAASGKGYGFDELSEIGFQIEEAALQQNEGGIVQLAAELARAVAAAQDECATGRDAQEPALKESPLGA